MKIDNLRCDYCEEQINSLKEGVLEFIADRDPKTNIKRCHDFYIVHQAAASPLYLVKLGGQSCYHNNKEKGFSDIDLDDLLENGLIDGLKRICPYEMKTGDEQLKKIIDRLLLLK